jgi:uncharacterized protein (DUF1800 family)
VAAALVRCPEAWGPERRKFKRPEEYLVSVFRATGAPLPRARTLLGALRDLGQLPYRSPGPDGWPDVADYWCSPDALFKRVELASALAARVADAGVDSVSLAREVLGPLLADDTVRTLRGAGDPEQGLALLLTSPEFLRR